MQKLKVVEKRVAVCRQCFRPFVITTINGLSFPINERARIRLFAQSKMLEIESNGGRTLISYRSISRIRAI